jgi:hypothetical protein
MYEISPNNKAFKDSIEIKYNEFGMPVWVMYGNEDDDIY